MSHDSGSRTVVIIGAAGRDFHNFNTCFRGNPADRVVAFTAAQIPNISGRTYPPELAGDGYPEGIPILPEARLEEIIDRERVSTCVFAYSDVTHQHVMHLASRCMAAGADFLLLGPDRTMLVADRPVVGVCAVRTGAGKSQTTRYVVERLHALGVTAAVVRHPMPYGDLLAQRVQRFATLQDLDRYDVTIEEREEFEPHLARDTVVYAGVDYAEILERAQTDGDVVVWDGGNNDLPFYRPDLHIVVADPHRPGHELRYHPGETNLRMADVVIINKTDSASADDVAAVRRNVTSVNESARILLGRSPLTVDRPELLRGKRVLAIEDGPTVTHGEMAYGAASLAARRNGAAGLVDPRAQAVGTIAETYRRYPEIGPLLPAMGYGTEQIEELEETIRRSDAEVVAVGTPVDLGRLIDVGRPVVRVTYELELDAPEDLDRLLAETAGL